MSEMTEEEWAGVQAALVRGGLRDAIDAILRVREDSIGPLSAKNQMLLFRAYDDQSGNTVVLQPGTDGYVVGVYDGTEMVEAIEIEDVLYSICQQSGGCVSVLVGDEIVNNEMGAVFRTNVEARAYIQGLTSK